MSDLIIALNMLGLTPYLVAAVVAFGAIALYFSFVNRS